MVAGSLKTDWAANGDDGFSGCLSHIPKAA